MPPTRPADSAALASQVSRFLDSDLSADECATLLERLRADPAALQRVARGR